MDKPTPAPNASAVDFSKASTARAVLSKSLQYPLTLYGTASGFLGGLALTLFDPTLITGAIAATGLTVGLGSWAINYFFRRDQLMREHIALLVRELSEQKASLRKKVEEDLAEIRERPELAERADQAIAQFQFIEAKFASFCEILSDKLDQKEITYARYLGTAEQVYLSVLDNLSNLTSILKSISAIGILSARRRLSELALRETRTRAEQAELETLEHRRTLYEEQEAKAADLLAQNEIAMTQIDRTAAAIAEVRTFKGRASVDLDSAMQDLAELAVRAQQYSIKS